MIVSPSNGWRCRAFIACAVAVMWSTAPLGAAAQPVSLTPDSLKEGDRDPTPNPDPNASVPPGAETGTQAMDAPAPATLPVLPGAVQIDGLAAVSSDAFGTLTEGNGGFPMDLWGTTRRSLALTLLRDLPGRTSSLVMRDVMRKLMLSAAVPPRPAMGPDGELETPPAGELLQARASLLLEMGDVGGMLSLLERLPRDARTDALAELEAEGRLLTNDIARACGLAGEQMTAADRPYWQRLFVFCQALSGEHEQAALGASLLREVGAADPAFFTLLRALAPGGEGKLDSLIRPTALHLAMARAAKVQLPGDVISVEEPALLRAIASGPNAEPSIRLEAAERAASTGAVDAEALRQLYTSVEFDAEMLANPLTTAKEKGGPVSRALLFTTAVQQTIPAAKAEAASVALKSARDGGRYATAVRAFLPIIIDIRPSTDLSWFAPEAARALLFADEGEAASRWFAILRNLALRDESLQRDAELLMPVAKLAGAPEADRWTVAQLPEWWDRIAGEENSKAHATLIFTVFAALGEPVPDEAWLSVIEGGQRKPVVMLSAPLWFRMLSASVNDRLGEGIALAMLAIGEAGPVAADPVVLGRVITALVNLGLTQEARALALEAAVQAEP